MHYFFSRIFIKAALLGIVFFLLNGCSHPTQTSTNSNPVVRISYLPVVQSLPLFVALEKGLFEKHNIQVEVKKIDSPNLIIDDMLSHNADYSFAAATGIVAVTETKSPGTIKIINLIGGNTSTRNDILFVGQNSKIQNFHDLKGSTIGILPGIQFRTIARHILEAENISLEEVHIVELAPGLQLQALETGQIDALLSIEPMGTIAEINGIGKAFIEHPMVSYISDPWYGAANIVRSDFATKNPTAHQTILDVITEAISFIEKNPESAKQYLATYTSLNKNISNKAPLPIFKKYHDITPADKNALQAFFQIFEKQQVIEKVPQASDIIY